MSNGRLLHYVFKVPKRAETVEFYRALGYKALRHEEFTEGCEAQVTTLFLSEFIPLLVQWTILGPLEQDNDWLRSRR